MNTDGKWSKKVMLHLDLNFKKWVKIIKIAGYNGAHTVSQLKFMFSKKATKIDEFFSRFDIYYISSNQW